MSTTVPYVVATLIADQYVDNGRPAMHHHYIGHTVDSIHELRYGMFREEGVPLDMQAINTSWPMVDLWTRVPVDVFRYGVGNDQDALRHAKAEMGISGEYTGQVGW